MKIKEIREMTDAELNHQHDELLKEKLNLKIQSKTGQLENPAKIRQVRRTIAKILTEKTSRAAAASGK